MRGPARSRGATGAGIVVGGSPLGKRMVLVLLGLQKSFERAPSPPHLFLELRILKDLQSPVFATAHSKELRRGNSRQLTRAGRQNRQESPHAPTVDAGKQRDPSLPCARSGLASSSMLAFTPIPPGDPHPPAICMVIKTKGLQEGQFGIDWKQKRYKRAKRAKQKREGRKGKAESRR